MIGTRGSGSDRSEEEEHAKRGRGTEVPPPEIRREHLVRTLSTLLDGDTRIVVVEGPDGIGKSTLLRQFHTAHADRTASMFVSSASRWAYDPQAIALELLLQLKRLVGGEETTEDAQHDDVALRRSVHYLSRKARREARTYYFVLDGLEDIPESDVASRNELVGLLPFGIEGFRFLLSGSLEKLPLNDVARRAAKPFPITYFTRDESDRFMDGFGLSHEQLDELYTVTHGIPGHLASVRRLLSSSPDTGSILTNLPGALPELFRLEWRVVSSADEQQQLLLAILAHENRPYSCDQLAAVSGEEASLVSRKMSALSFLELDQAGCFRFVSESYRRFAAAQLTNLRHKVNDLFIDFLLRDPESDEALTSLPTFFTNAKRLRDLVHYLSPERFARLYQRTPSLRVVQQKAQQGIAAAQALQRDAEQVRFTIQKCAIEEIALSDIGVSEVRAMAAIGDYDTAFALADQSPRIDTQFRLLAAIARVRKEQGLAQDPELLARIRNLFKSLDAPTFGRQLGSVASDLFYTSPDLAIELISHGRGDLGENAIDWGFAALSIQAQLVANDPNAHERARTISERIKDPAAKRLSNEASIILGHLSATQAIAEAERLEATGDRLYVLQKWMVANRDRGDAHDVLHYGLRAALQATTYTANALVYRELASCLPYMAHVQQVSYYTGLIDAQRAVLEQLGPTEDFVRLQLIMVRAEWRHDRAIARNRFMEVYNTVARIKDLVVRTACMARLTAALAHTDPTREMDSDSELHELASQELEEGINKLLSLSAEHFEACRGVIEALAVSRPAAALAIIIKINTEWRRDQAHQCLVEAMATGPLEHMDITSLDRALDSIIDSDVFDSAVESLVKAARRRRLGDTTLANLLPTLLKVLNITKARTRALLCAQLASMLTDRTGTDTEAALAKVTGGLRSAWEAVDEDWEKLDLAYDIVTIAGREAPILAREYVERTNDLKPRLTIYDSETAIAATMGIRLAIRAFAGLLQRELDSEEDVERLVSVIGRSGSLRQQADLISELAVRFHFNGRKEECSRLVQQRLVPLVLALPKADPAYRASVVIDVAPALFLGAAASATAILIDLPELWRQEALNRIAWVVLMKLPWSEPYEFRPRVGFDITFEDANTVISLMRQMNADWAIYRLIEVLVDSTTGSAHRDNFKRAQRAEILRQLEELANEKFPSARYIQHDGYLVASRAQLNRMKDATQATSSSLLASAARAIPNVADKAYVMAIVAATSRSAVERQRYMTEARSIVDTIPMLADRIDRYSLMSRLLIDIDAGVSKELLRKALQLSFTGEGTSIAERRMSLIDLAYRVYPESAAALASTSDDDPAKLKVEQQLRLYRLRDVLALRRRPANAPVVHDAFEFSRVAWLKLASLNGARSASVPPDRALPALGYAAPQPISRAYPIFAWFIENAVRHTRSLDAIRGYVLPLFEACLRGAELAIRTSVRNAPQVQRLLEFGGATPQDLQRIVVEDGERREGLAFLREWLRLRSGRTLWIMDPYFGPDSMELLTLIRDAAEDFEVVVVASRKESLKGVTPPYEDAYRAAWNRLSSDDPPTTTLIFAGSREGGKFPVHDRWWLAEDGGLSFGTSYQGIGSRLSEIRPLSGAEALEVMARLKPYFTQSRQEFEGERLLYTSFSL